MGGDAETMTGEGGRQYHIGLAPGELGDFVLMCGDPARARRFAETHMDEVEMERGHREYLTFTGHTAGTRVSVMATGMGPDNTEIAVVECLNIAKRPTFIRMGSCGSIQPNVGLGDLVVSTGAVRLENTSSFYVPEGFPAVPDLDVTLALREACNIGGRRWHMGPTATAPGFYGAQGRTSGGLYPIRPQLLDELARCGILNFEMESSVLFTLASVAGARAGTVCAVYANRATGKALDEAGRRDAEGRCLKTVVQAVRLLSGGK